MLKPNEAIFEAAIGKGSNIAMIATFAPAVHRHGGRVSGGGGLLLGVIADDFTGASDIANTLARGVPERGGLRTTQFIGLPSRPPSPDVEAEVVSPKTRSNPVSEAAQSLATLSWLRAHGCRQFVFNYCSTFDSTPAGNIGPVGKLWPMRSESRASSLAPRSRRPGALFIVGTCSSMIGS